VNPALSAVRSLSLWQGNVDIVPLSGGVSNSSFVVTDATGKYVARVGSNYPFHQVDREREAIASTAAHVCDLSPEMIYSSGGIMVLRYIEARTYAEADVRKHWQASLELLCRTHHDMGKHITGQAAIFWVFQILRDYGARLVAARYRLANEMSGWMTTVDELEAAQISLPIVFGHHDLLPSNIMDDGKRLWLIDWEYGAFGTAMFDLANLSANNSFDATTEHEMLTGYFGHAPDLATSRAFMAMKVASALREALWGMISELYLAAPGVDYDAYAREYLSRFKTIKAAYAKDFT
jgi:thiamine kinase-like enzyme